VAIKCPKCHFDNPNDTTYCGKCATLLASPRESPFSQTETIQSPVNELTTGSTFAGRYQVIEELGHGGMGRVYKVFDTDIKERVALKLLRPEIALDKETVERFSNELKLARKISHRNVCRMFDLGKAGSTTFITMEFVPGEDLKGLIRKMGQLGAGRAVSIAKQVSEGLAEAHHLGIIHRDLKPQNIMVDEDGNVRIMDFGIARSLRAKGITGAGVMIGTPEYMSPEQVEGKPADQRTDIYSLGVILFEMVVGCPPFEGETPFSIANKHKSEPPPVPKKLLPQLPDALNKIILRCLEKDKANRYQTAEELVTDLAAVEQTLPLTERALIRAKTKTRISREITVKLSPRRLVIPAAAAVVLLAFIILGSKFLFKKRVNYPPPLENSFVIVSFDNKTGDKSQDAFRNVFPDIMRTKFEQTGVRYVATFERMTDLLKQAGKTDVDFIDSELGFELARRDGVKALVAGSYSRSGSMFVTTLRIIDVETKASLATASASGTGSESILTTQIDELCRQIFPRLSFSQAQLEKAKTPIVDYSTKSLEAYKNYVLGEEARKKWKLAETKEYYEKAIGIDPEFALAYLGLVDVLPYTGEMTKAMEYLEKAQALRFKVPEKERMQIEWNYASLKDGDLGRCVAILEEYTKIYPKDAWALLWLGTAYRCFLGRYDESTALYKKASVIDPSLPTANEILVNLYLAKDLNKYRDLLNRTFDSKSIEYIAGMGDLSFLGGDLNQAILFYKKTPSFPMGFVKPNVLHYCYALKEEWPEALRQLDAYAADASTPELKFQAYVLKAMHESCLGSPSRAARDLQEAQRLLGNAQGAAEDQFFQVLIDWARFWIAHDQGDLAACRQSLPAWPERSIQMFVSKTYFKLTALLARGSLDLQEKRMDLVKQTLSEMEGLDRDIGPLKMPFSSSTDAERARFLLANFQAEVHLAEGSPKKAVSVLAGISPPEPPDFQNTQFLIIYLAPFFKDALARAYEQMGDLDRAIAEYQRLLRVDPKIGPRFPPHPKYHLRLAKLFERTGNKLKASEEYSRFLDLWKSADPGQAAVEDARRSLALLNRP